ncbi:hypothetical protein BpHYR1_049439 [Brachionus plicatilis]|uniref:Uncharacterized protein n=1 Tax=Brachionus plicatilis TaxID=10195 RepID=A0A3M7P259_BRAPC|nr:hypothetical protein BpHYR1_049439 [Brachionus plicatilis]
MKAQYEYHALFLHIFSYKLFVLGKKLRREKITERKILRREKITERKILRGKNDKREMFKGEKNKK